MPENNFADAYTTLKTKAHSDATSSLDCVKHCETARIKELFALQFRNIEDKLTFLEEKMP